MVQRSCDMFLGVPFNIASYALLTHMIAQVTGLRAKELVLTLNDAHIYESHYSAIEKQLKRKPYSSPRLYLNESVKSIDDFMMNDIALENYTHHQTIKAKMVV